MATSVFCIFPTRDRIDGFDNSSWVVTVSPLGELCPKPGHHPLHFGHSGTDVVPVPEIVRSATDELGGESGEGLSGRHAVRPSRTTQGLEQPTPITRQPPQ